MSAESIKNKVVRPRWADIAEDDDSSDEDWPIEDDLEVIRAQSAQPNSLNMSHSNSSSRSLPDCRVYDDEIEELTKGDDPDNMGYAIDPDVLAKINPIPLVNGGRAEEEILEVVSTDAASTFSDSSSSYSGDSSGSEDATEEEQAEKARVQTEIDNRQRRGWQKRIAAEMLERRRGPTPGVRENPAREFMKLERSIAVNGTATQPKFNVPSRLNPAHNGKIPMHLYNQLKENKEEEICEIKRLWYKQVGEMQATEASLENSVTASQSRISELELTCESLQQAIGKFQRGERAAEMKRLGLKADKVETELKLTAANSLEFELREKLSDKTWAEALLKKELTVKSAAEGRLKNDLQDKSAVVAELKEKLRDEYATEDVLRKKLHDKAIDEEELKKRIQKMEKDLTKQSKEFEELKKRVEEDAAVPPAPAAPRGKPEPLKPEHYHMWAGLHQYFAHVRRRCIQHDIERAADIKRWEGMGYTVETNEDGSVKKIRTKLDDFPQRKTEWDQWKDLSLEAIKARIKLPPSPDAVAAAKKKAEEDEEAQKADPHLKRLAHWLVEEVKHAQ